jgi:hypothetical protein
MSNGSFRPRRDPRCRLTMPRSGGKLSSGDLSHGCPLWPARPRASPERRKRVSTGERQWRPPWRGSPIEEGATGGAPRAPAALLRGSVSEPAGKGGQARLRRAFIAAVLSYSWVSLGSCGPAQCGSGCPGLGGEGGSCRSDPLTTCSIVDRCTSLEPCQTALGETCVGSGTSVLDGFIACISGPTCGGPDSRDVAGGCHSDDEQLVCCASDAGDSPCATELRAQIAVELSIDAGR